MANRENNYSAFRAQLSEAISDPSQIEEAHWMLANSDADLSGALQIDKDTLALGNLNHGATGQLTKIINQVENYQHPCIAFDTDGKIIAANHQANTVLKAEAGMSLKNLAINSEDRATLLNHCRRVEAAGDASRNQKIMRTQLEDDARVFSTVLIPTEFEIECQRYFFAILIDLAGSSEFLNNISESYDLSTSEQDVLKQFLAGSTLKDISEVRGRAIATIRTQFYTITRKLGANSQVELLNNLMVFSNIFSNSVPIKRNSKHPFRQEAVVLRPHGRIVEVILSGDPKGIPVIHIATLYQRAFPAKTEKMFKDAGLFIITIVTIGRGKTSPMAPDMCEELLAVDDIKAVLDQLSIDSAILFSTDDILRVSVLLSKQLSTCLKHILIASPVLPAIYERLPTQSQHLYGVTKQLHLLKPHMRNISMRLFWQSLTILRARGMVKLFLRNNQADLRECLEPDTLEEIQAAFDSVLSAGFERCSSFHVSTFDDWQTQISDCPTPITIYEGSQSFLCNIGHLKRFAADYSAVVRVVNCDIEGMALPYIRPELMIEMITSVATSN